MRLLDSNIVIYATQSSYAHLLPLLHASNCYISEITKLEVLGYHGFDAITKQNMRDLFETLQMIPINSVIIDKAVEIRQLRKMAMGDAIIAATALLNDCELLTRNVTDFKSLGLVVSNPM
jgi:predicted nucleic acid-binding protein